jgi:hypothetical protein
LSTYRRKDNASIPTMIATPIKSAHAASLIAGRNVWGMPSAFWETMQGSASSHESLLIWWVARKQSSLWIARSRRLEAAAAWTPSLPESARELTRRDGPWV